MPNWTAWSREAVAAMNANNRAWVAQYGLEGAPYRWDLATAELVFDRGRDHVVADLCLVATVSQTAGTFQRAWADDAVPAAATRGLEAVRAFGEAHDLPRLTTPEWPAGRADGLEMLAAAGRIQESSGGFVDGPGDLLLFFTLHRFRVRS